MAIERRDQSYECLAEAWQFHKGVYEKQVMQVEPSIATKNKISIAILNTEIVEAKYKNHHILPIVLKGDAKVEHDNKWRAYRERIEKSDNHYL